MKNDEFIWILCAESIDGCITQKYIDWFFGTRKELVDYIEKIETDNLKIKFSCRQPNMMYSEKESQ